MAIEPISAISASQRAQALAAAQDIPAGSVASTPASDAARQQAALAAQIQTAQPQETSAQTAAREAAAAARAAEIQNGGAQTQAAQARDAVRQAIADTRAATAARQGGLAPLFADLTQAAGETAAAQAPSATAPAPQAPAPQTSPAPALPAEVRQAIDQVLALRLPTSETITADSLRQAVEQSGLFLEARLARQADADGPTDLKAALLVLKQALTAAAAPSTPAEDVAPETLSNAAPPPGSPLRQSPPAASPPPSTAGSPAPQPAPEADAAPPTVTPRAPPAASNAPPDVVAGGPAAHAQAAATLAQRAATPIDEPTETTVPTTAAPTAPPTTRPTAAQALQTAQQAAADAAVIETAEQADQQAARQIVLATQTLQTAQAAQATQAARPTALDIARMVSQSSLLLAAQEAAMPDEDERHLVPPLPAASTAKEDIAPVARVLGLQPLLPPVRDSALGGQGPAIAALPRGADAAAVIQHLSQDVDQALARQTLHQLESLQAGVATEGAPAAWMFEIPIATPQGTAIAQFEIDRDGRRAGDADAGPGWRARFAIDVEPLGPVHVHLSMNGGQTAATVYAERPGSLERLRAQGEMLARELSGEVAFHIGAPRRPVAASGHFVDQRT